jgi:hypothetical protein
VRQTPHKAATTPASTTPTAPASPPFFKLSAPPLDCSTELEVVDEPVWLAEEVDEPLASAATLEAEDTTDVAEEAALSEAEEAAEEALLSGAGVELGAAEPSQVAAVGRSFTP